VLFTGSGVHGLAGRVDRAATTGGTERGDIQEGPRVHSASRWGILRHVGWTEMRHYNVNIKFPYGYFLDSCSVISLFIVRSPLFIYHKTCK
jgi:hypothetical protein